MLALTSPSCLAPLDALTAKFQSSRAPFPQGETGRPARQQSGDEVPGVRDPDSGGFIGRPITAAPSTHSDLHGSPPLSSPAAVVPGKTNDGPISDPVPSPFPARVTGAIGTQGTVAPEPFDPGPIPDFLKRTQDATE